MTAATIIILVSGLALIWLCQGVAAGWYDYGFSAESIFEKRQLNQSPVVRTLPLVDGVIPWRKEIRLLEKDNDSWNLFILGLNWMQYMEQHSKYSWYQIAGMFARYILF
jgi:tyrosinase